MTAQPRQARGRGGADIGYLLNKVTRRFRLRLADALADTGLTPQQAAVLMVIARTTGGRLTPRAIADSIDTDQATTSGLIERLTRDGWLVAEPNPGDGRSRLIGLTEKAQSSLPQVYSAADRVSSEATSVLSASEVEMLSELLGRLSGTEAATTGRAGTQ